MIQTLKRVPTLRDSSPISSKINCNSKIACIQRTVTFTKHRDYITMYDNCAVRSSYSNCCLIMCMFIDKVSSLNPHIINSHIPTQPFLFINFKNARFINQPKNDEDTRMDYTQCRRAITWTRNKHYKPFSILKNILPNEDLNKITTYS